MPAFLAWKWPHAESWLWVAVVGLAGTFSHFCLSKALSLGEASVVMPMDFLRVPLTARDREAQATLKADVLVRFEHRYCYLDGGADGPRRGSGWPVRSRWWGWTSWKSGPRPCSVAGSSSGWPWRGPS